MPNTLPVVSPAQVREHLLARREIALVDLREEDPYAQAHPLWSVQLSAARLELDAPWRLPRRDVTLVLFDDGEGLVEAAGRTLAGMGYTAVQALAGGLQGWRDAGGELFRDVNVPSKAFGELVEHERHTPSLSAQEVLALIQAKADMVVLDARRFDEYQTMSIPTGVSVPGGELALRVRDLAPDPRTRVIVNCAGRTRSIIGTQSLVNAGIPNPVAALRNGTIGWTLAGQTLDHGQQRHFGPVAPEHLAAAQRAAQALADRAGVRRIDAAGLAAWRADAARTVYCWDVRTPAEYAAGHRAGFGSAPGGQLVQETDVCCAVRGARIVLADGGPGADGVRAPMAAHWLAQMGWEVAWLTDEPLAGAQEEGAWQSVALPAGSAAAAVPRATPAELAHGLNEQDTVLLDFQPSARHVKAHIPGARWALRAQRAAWWPALAAALPAGTRQIVCTCGDGTLSAWAASDLQRHTDLPVRVLDGGQAAWVGEGRALRAGDDQLLSPRIDRYRRPYEGTDAPREAMQGYLDWEFGLVAQLGRDGTHFFEVLPAA